MTAPLPAEAIAPLLHLVTGGEPAPVRVAALDAATRLPLDPDAWAAVAQAVLDFVRTEPVGSPSRQEAMRLAVRVPLRSVRDALRRMADDPGEADRDAIAQALAEARDSSRISALLDAAARGDDVYRLLAAMPVEERLAAADIPAAPAHAPPGLHLWRALTLARLGDFAALDAIVESEYPDRFDHPGDPWSSYALLARMRPVPEPMRAHLMGWLDRLDASRARGEHPGIDRLPRLVVNALTGIADAQGEPLRPAAPLPSPRALPSPQERRRAIAARERLPQVLFERDRDVGDDLQALWALAPAQVARLIVDVVVAGHRKAGEIGHGGEGGAVVGWADDIVSMVRNLPVTDDWPVAELVLAQLNAAHGVLDDGQLAWVIGRAAPQRVLDAVSPWMGAGVPVEQRLRVLALLARVADEWSARAGSPFRGAGAGAGAGAPAGGIDLIDDRAASAARPDQRPGEAGPPAPLRRTRRGGPGAVAAPSAVPADSGAAGPDAEERVVNTRILLDGRQRRAFVAGAGHVVRCWIALPEATAAHAEVAVPRVDIPQAGLPLTVQLAWRDVTGEEHTDSGLMVLPADRTLPSNACDLRLQVPTGQRSVSVDIVFRYGGRVFEAVCVEADVVLPDQPDSPRTPLVHVQARRREVLELDGSRPVDATVDFDGEDLRVFGTPGSRIVRLSLARGAVEWLAATLHATEKVVARRREAQATAALALDADDPDVRRLLRDMARMGADLYQQLRTPGAAFVDPGDRIELLDRGTDAYVPLEFVYDRGYPVDEAPLCREGIAALDSDATHCPRCGRAPPSEEQLAEAAVVCPFGFWSMRKVIERIADGRHGQASLPRALRRRLPPVDSALLAAYDKVGAEEVAATRDELERTFGRLAVAGDWRQWRDAVGEQPRLLVLLAHHGTTGPEDYLQIGAETLSADLGRLGRGQIGRPYVNPLGQEPGPIVLLLGCQTAEDASAGYAPLARRVYEQRAAIVLGTLADVLGRDAAPLARELVRELASVDDAAADFGTIMRRVRRRLLARGNLVALCLVALGDGEWRLSPRAARLPT
jgi:hypothetical protein